MSHIRTIAYFAYGTLQSGFANHAKHAEDLSRPLGQYRTEQPYPLAVPNEAACPNPGCPFVHRVGALLNDPGDGQNVEGEVFLVTVDALGRLDKLESYRPEDEALSIYLRRPVLVAPIGGGALMEAQVYFIADPEPYRQLLADGRASTVDRYLPELAESVLKACCRADPDHTGPHDVTSPFESQTL